MLLDKHPRDFFHLHSWHELLSLLDLVFLFAFLYILKQFITTKSRHPFPPGPSGLPILGNLLDWPVSKGWLTFTSWGTMYGDLVHVNVLGTHMIIVNSVEKATSMLQDVNYIDRPSSFFLAEVVGWKHVLTFLNDGPRFKAGRRLFKQILGTKSLTKRFSPMIQPKTQDFIRKILDDPRPESLRQHIRAYSAAIILDLTYSYHVKDGHDEFVETAELAMNIASVGTHGSFLVDHIHWLAKLPAWFPGTGFMQAAAPLRRALFDLSEKPYEFVKDQLAAGVAHQSVVGYSLENHLLTPEEVHNVKWTAVGLFAGAADTTPSSIQSFFLFMTLYPEVQQRGKVEIASIIGHDRLPKISDRPHLPYTNAIIKEVFRLGPVVPMGIPHRATADDVFDGFLIPKNALIFPNVWFMARDPQIYNEPEAFNPERFMGESPELDPAAFFFGFGKRKCPGRLFADDNMFLACATILATLDISKARDEKGHEIIPEVECVGDMITHPKQFPCVVKPQSAHVEALVRQD